MAACVGGRPWLKTTLFGHEIGCKNVRSFFQGNALLVPTQGMRNGEVGTQRRGRTPPVAVVPAELTVLVVC